MRRFLIFLLIFLSAQFTWAQRPPSGTGGSQSGQIQSAPDTSGQRRGTFFTVFHGRPGKAALYSLLLPGAGQVYNGRIWKLPLVYALEGTAVYFLVQTSRDYNTFSNCYQALVIDNSNPPAYCQNITTVADAFRIKNSYRSDRDISLLFLIGAHILQTLEAFIDRHLIDFDVDEDLTFAAPNHLTNEIAQIKFLNLRIPLNNKKKSLINPAFESL